MRSIALINQKGGVGKTTTAVNVAAALARSQARVLLVDLDPQSHATMHLGIEPESATPGIYDVLVNGTEPIDAVHKVSERLLVIPAHVDLVGADVELARRPNRELLLREALGALADRCDVLLIDCPPSLGTLTINALAAVEEVIIPLQPHFLALQGLGRLLETVALVRGVLNPSLRISGVVLCLFEKGTRLAQEVDSDVRQFIAQAAPEDPWHAARVFDTTIRRNIKLAECPSFGQTIFEYAPRSRGAEDYRALAHEIFNLPMPAAEQQGAEVGQTADAPDTPVELPASATTSAAHRVEAAKAQVVQQASADADTVVPPGSAIRLEPSQPAVPPGAPVAPDAATP
jgi:chromosome partitioning protein